jgi:hypothetical protein
VERERERMDVGMGVRPSESGGCLLVCGGVDLFCVGF